MYSQCCAYITEIRHVQLSCIISHKMTCQEFGVESCCHDNCVILVTVSVNRCIRKEPTFLYNRQRCKLSNIDLNCLVYATPCMADLRRTYGGHMANIRRTYGEHTADTSLLYGKLNKKLELLGSI